MEDRTEPLVRPKRRRALLWSMIGVAVIAIVAVVGISVQRAGGSGGEKKSAQKTEKKNEKKKKKGDEGPLASPVELATARRGRISTFLQSTTTLEPRNSAVLVARRSGEVIALLAEEGQWLKKGQPLARLDDREARLKVQRTELAAEMASREIERAKQLSEKGYMSPREQDDLEVKRRNAWVELEQARFELSQMTITAPFSGRIVDRMVQLGETVTEGKECFRIVDFDPLLARLYFPERELTRIQVGQEAVVTMDAHPGHLFRGRVSLVNPVVDRTNGTFKVTLEISNNGGVLRPGTFARARIKTGEFAGAVLMPRRGLLTEDGEDYVFVAHGDSVTRVPVSVGAVEGDSAQILAGLREGDSVVTVGHGGLKTGTKIKPVTL